MAKRKKTEPAAATLDGIPVREFTGFPQPYAEIGEGGTEETPLVAGISALNFATLYFFVGKGGKRKFAVKMQDLMNAFCEKLPQLLEVNDADRRADRRGGSKAGGQEPGDCS